VPVEVCDSENDDLIGINSVKQSIWKPVHEATPDVQLDDGPALGILGNVRYSRRDLLEKLTPQPAYLQLVIDGCFEHLFLGWLHHANGLHRNRA
jgi:hypothetical protein